MRELAEEGKRPMKRKTFRLLGAFCLLALSLALVWYTLRPAGGSAGDKSVTVSVTHGGGATKEFTYQTDRETLGELLEEEGLISGTEGPYGLFVDTVDGETADYGRDGAWWRLTEEGQDAAAGVDEVILRDGGHYGWIYTAG